MYRIYCDFDATVTVNDVWDSIFKTFGKPNAFTVWEKFNTGEYSAAQCITEACASVENGNAQAVAEMFRAQELRTGFLEFVDFCKAEELEITIVSDGFSMYIRSILAQHGLYIPYFTNTIELQTDGTLSVEFPHSRESCRRCGACKCGAIVTTSADDDTIVYIGDGYSDVCPIEIADVVFARDMLRSFCGKKGIPYHSFEDFYTIIEILKTYLAERPKYKRKEAEKNRHKLYVTE